jgi:hypothetical protein
VYEALSLVSGEYSDDGASENISDHLSQAFVSIRQYVSIRQHRSTPQQSAALEDGDMTQLCSR